MEVPHPPRPAATTHSSLFGRVVSCHYTASEGEAGFAATASTLPRWVRLASSETVLDPRDRSVPGQSGGPARPGRRVSVGAARGQAALVPPAGDAVARAVLAERPGLKAAFVRGSTDPLTVGRAPPQVAPGGRPPAWALLLTGGWRRCEDRVSRRNAARVARGSRGPSPQTPTPLETGVSAPARTGRAPPDVSPAPST